MGSENGNSKGSSLPGGLKLIEAESGESALRQSPQSSTDSSPKSPEAMFNFPELYLMRRVRLMGTLSKARGSQGIKDARLRSFLEREWVLFIQVLLEVSGRVLEPDESSALKSKFEQLLEVTATGSLIQKPD